MGREMCTKKSQSGRFFPSFGRKNPLFRKRGEGSKDKEQGTGVSVDCRMGKR